MRTDMRNGTKVRITEEYQIKKLVGAIGTIAGRIRIVDYEDGMAMYKVNANGRTLLLWEDEIEKI